MARSLAKLETPDDTDVEIRFDPSTLPEDMRQPLEEDTRKLREGLIEIALTLLDAGERFTRWKERLPHGAYLPWVATTGYSEQKARNVRNVFKRFRDHVDLFTELDLALPETAIVHLATAPDNAFEDVMDLLKEREKLSLDEVKAIIKRHRDRENGNVQEEGAKKPDGTIGADGLRALAERALDELVPAVIERMAKLLHAINDVEAGLSRGKVNVKKVERELRPQAQWLTDALEQLTQRRAISTVSLVHVTFLDRPDHLPGVWADAASFLRDIGHSVGWERHVKSANLLDVLTRGRQVLQAVLPPERHRSFHQY